MIKEMSRAHPCLTFLSTDFKIGVLDPIRPFLHIVFNAISYFIFALVDVFACHTYCM